MTRELQPCGTPAAYSRHLRYKQTPCQACRNASWARLRATTKGLPPCAACGADRADKPHRGAHEWCCACYHRWLRAGRPKDGPPLPPAARREDYEWLRGQGTSIEEAAERVGVKAGTAVRWERRAKVGASA